MNIAIINNDSWGIINYRLNLARALENQGHNVLLISPKDEGYHSLLQHGFKHEVFHLDRLSKNPFKELIALYKLQQTIKHHKIDLCLSFTIKANLYTGLISRLLNIAFAPNITGMGSAGSSALLKPIYQLALSKANTVFCQNQDDANQLISNHIAHSRQVKVLPGSGVDLSKFKAKQDFHFPTRRYLFIARILKDKGIEQFCEAAKALSSESREFIVLGRADERETEALDCLKRYHEQGFVNYKGLVDNVDEEMEQAFCSILPSWYREGVPRSLLESLASGLPIITTQEIGCKEALRDGKNGFACKKQDTQSLIDAIQKLEQLSEDEYITLSKFSHEFAKSTFDESIVLNHYLKLGKAVHDK